MATRDDSKREWEIPRLKEAHQFPATDQGVQDFWSVKFYPYTEPGLDPVFAVVGGGTRILVCRVAEKEHTQLEVIQMIREEGDDANNYACAWTKNLETGDPLLCVAGMSGIIKIYDVLTGRLLRTLAGHGGEINELAVSPVNPYILASCSEDVTIRIWSLDPAHAADPCAALIEGDGHRDIIWTIAFHASGRYLLSGAADYVINLWTLPDFPDANTGTSTPTRIYYPHFSTAEIHADCVDCVAWWGDLILSKAANENTIVLWSINKFSSALPPPSPSTAPTLHQAHRYTRSSFVHPLPASSTDNAFHLYTRHLQFSLTDSEINFTRFSLFPGVSTPGSGSASCPSPDRSHPILAFCSTRNRMFYWDLARLERFYDDAPALPASNYGPNPITPSPRPNRPQIPSDAAPRAHPFLLPTRGRGRGRTSLNPSLGRLGPARKKSPAESGSTGSGGERSEPGRIDWVRSRQAWEREYGMREPVARLARHREEVVKAVLFTGRQVAWSPCGSWCVVVGSSGVIALSQRWGGVGE